MQPRTFRLSNGLRVHHYPHSGNVVGLLLGMPVGARRDPPGREGIGHALEHMLFNGVERWSEREMRDEVERRGGDSNAITLPDCTCYHIALPGGDLGFGLDYLSQLVFAPTLPPSLFEREMRIIDNEAAGSFEEKPLARLHEWMIDRALNYNVLADTAIRALLTGSRLTTPVAGYAAARRRATLADLRAHYRRYYLPNHAALVVIGGDAAQLRAEVEARFGGLPAGSPPLPPPPPNPGGLGQRRVCWLMTPEDELEVIVGFSTAVLAADELPALDLLMSLVEDELLERLRLELGYVYSVKAGYALYSDGGAILVRIKAHHRRVKQTERESLAILDRLNAGQFDPGRFERVRQALVGRAVVRLASMENTFCWLYNLPHIFTDQPPLPPASALPGVSPDDVRRLAARLFAPSNRLVVAHQPSRLRMFVFWLAVFGVVFAITGAGVLLAAVVKILLKLR